GEAGGATSPAVMRRSVDLPQPEAPIRQTNSPLAIESVASESAWIVCSCSWNCLETRPISTMGMVASAMMARAPAQQAVADHHDHAVGEVAREPDHDHAADHQVEWGQGAGVPDQSAT